MFTEKRRIRLGDHGRSVEHSGSKTLIIIKGVVTNSAVFRGILLNPFAVLCWNIVLYERIIIDVASRVVVEHYERRIQCSW